MGGGDILCLIQWPMAGANKPIWQSSSMENLLLMPIHDVILQFHTWTEIYGEQEGMLCANVFQLNDYIIQATFPEYTTAAEIPTEVLAAARENKSHYPCYVGQKKAQN